MRRMMGFIAGYLISLFPSFLLFRLAGQDPGRPASLGFMVFASLYGMAFALLGGWVAVQIDRFATGRLVAAMIAALSLLSILTDQGASHWARLVALLLMAPAAYAGAKFAHKRE